MKIVIDEDIGETMGLSFPEILMVLLVKTKVDIEELISDMLKKEILIKTGTKVNWEKNRFATSYAVTQRWDDVCSNILLSGDKDVPKEKEIIPIAKQLMEIFPNGKKLGTNLYWKGNLKDTTLRLKKFYKLYGNKYAPEDIIQAAKKYVDSFNGNYSYMRVLKYFIWKADKKIGEDGKGYIDETSELATIIENKDEDINQDWTTEVR